MFQDNYIFLFFSESESYENFFPTRIDNLIKDAKELEDNVLQQKDSLRARLHSLADALKMSNQHA